MAKVKTVETLRNEMLEVFDQIRAGQISHKDCKEISNISGKIIASAKLELEYRAYMGVAEDVPFLKTYK